MQYFLKPHASKISALLLCLVAGLTACSESKQADVAAAEESVSEAASVPTNVAYISSQKAGITQVDLETMSVLKTFDAKAKSPRGIGITEDGRYLIVATRENGSISIIDTTTGEVVKQIFVGKNPEFVRVKGNYAFISSEPSAVGGPPPKPGAHEEEDEDDDDDDALPAKIAVVDLTEGKLIREITGGPETEGIEFSADGKLLVITNEADNTITVHDIESGELVKTVETEDYGKRPRGIKISPDGETYIATLEFGNQFLVLDKDFNVLKAVNTGETPYGVAFDDAGKHIYVATNRAHKLEVYDASTHEQVMSADSGKRCWHFSFTPDNQKILLACGKSDDVYVYNTNDLSLSSKLDVPGMPWGVLTYPKSMGSLDTK